MLGLLILVSLRGLQVASTSAKELDICSNSLRSIRYASEGNPLTSREHGWGAVGPQTLFCFSTMIGRTALGNDSPAKLREQSRLKFRLLLCLLNLPYQQSVRRSRSMFRHVPQEFELSVSQKSPGAASLY
jgi:hypothetical protein